MDEIKLHEKLVDAKLFTWAELRLITQINGYSVETLNDAIFARYGFENWAQLEERLEKIKELEQLEEEIKKLKEEIYG